MQSFPAYNWLEESLLRHHLKGHDGGSSFKQSRCQQVVLRAENTFTAVKLYCSRSQPIQIIRCYLQYLLGGLASNKMNAKEHSQSPSLQNNGYCEREKRVLKLF